MELTPSAVEQNQTQQVTLPASLRWLQVCLLLLFGHDVLCFSLGYPFLPSLFGGAATGVAFSSYGAASILVLLLLLFCSSNSSTARQPNTAATRSSSSNKAITSASGKFWRIMAAAALAAGAGAANTVLPGSYTVLLLTKAAQGAASALYFCESLSLVAAVYPQTHRTQAMAFISAGLTAGDALGPVLGGWVYQGVGLQGALGLQPAASLLALSAWALLLLWPACKRPWAVLAGAQVQQQQQQQHLQDEEQGGVACAPSSCGGSTTVAAIAVAAKTVGSVPAAAVGAKSSKWDKDNTVWLSSSQCQSSCIDSSLIEPLLPQSDAAAASDTPAQPLCGYHKPQQHEYQQYCLAAAAAAPSRPQLLLQLLARPSISSLCLLAFMAQAARTAVDLLLPIMLGSQVPPGVIGLLFAGEAVGSVVAPFLVDWMLHRHSSSSSSPTATASSTSSVITSNSRSSAGNIEDTAVVTATAIAGVTGQTTAQVKALPGGTAPGTSASSNTQYASWLLLLSAVGMAICCALVLTLWQLPAALHATAGAGRSAVGTSSSATPHSAAVMVGGSQPPMKTLSLTTSHSFPTYGEPVAAMWNQRVAGVLVSNSTGTVHVVDVLGRVVLLRSLQHSHWDVRVSPVLPPAPSLASNTSNASSAGSSSFSSSGGSVSLLGALTGLLSVEGLGETGGGSMVGSGSFGVAELCIIGVMLMLLGSWHSSCETLIYTVLTDIIAPSSSEASGPDAPWLSSASCVGEAERATCLLACGDDFDDSRDEGHGTHCWEQLQQAAAGSAAGLTEGLTRCVLPGFEGAGVESNGAAPVVAAAGAPGLVDAGSASCGVSTSAECTSSSTLSADGIASNEFDVEVCVSDQDSSSCCSLKVTHSLSHSKTESESESSMMCVAAADKAVAGQRLSSVAGPTSSAELDCTAVVMVLYVLFWVMGFSAGAGLVGLLPGNSVGQLQAVAAVLGFVLTAAGRWAWVAVAS